MNPIDDPMLAAMMQDKAQPVRIRLLDVSGASYEIEGDVRLRAELIEFGGKTYRYRGDDGRWRLYFETEIVRVAVPAQEGEGT